MLNAIDARRRAGACSSRAAGSAESVELEECRRRRRHSPRPVGKSPPSTQGDGHGLGSTITPVVASTAARSRSTARSGAGRRQRGPIPRRRRARAYRDLRSLNPARRIFFRRSGRDASSSAAWSGRHPRARGPKRLHSRSKARSGRCRKSTGPAIPAVVERSESRSSVIGAPARREVARRVVCRSAVARDKWVAGERRKGLPLGGRRLLRCAPIRRARCRDRIGCLPASRQAGT